MYKLGMRVKVFDLHVRLDKKTRNRLKCLSEHYEVTVAEVVRLLIKQEAEKLDVMPRAPG